MRKKKRQSTPQLDISSKANRILNLVFIGFLLIILRIWHLGIIQHEERSEEARKPQRRVIVESSKRGTIRDRFNFPLAINKVRYNAALLYSQIRQIPSVVWEKKEGQRVPRFKRKEYISQLAKLLAYELQLDSDRLEDLIHAKASFYTQHPFVIKEDLTEKEYYRLKILEKDWLGIQTQLSSKRYYPLGKVAGDIIGYMGAISREEYEKVIEEIGTLEAYLKAIECSEECSLPQGIFSPQEVENRLATLIDHAYSLNDSVGKMGVEGKFEEILRGFHGKKIYYSDARGNYLRELEGAKEAQSGQRVLLTISAELQEFAEKILIQNESMRDVRVEGRETEKEPWMKGGAIVALDPIHGEILALASYPRYDPNDFIPSGSHELANSKNRNIRRWLESEAYIGEMWDQKRPLERERYDSAREKIVEEKTWLTWDQYLQFILPKDSPVRKSLQKIGPISNALLLQVAVEKLLNLCGQPNAYAMFNALYQEPDHKCHKRLQLPGQKEALAENMKTNEELIRQIKSQIDPFFSGISHNYDKVLLVDLCRLVVDADRFHDNLLNIIGFQSLADYRDASAAMVVLKEVVREFSKDLFHTINFKEWRRLNQKEYLKQKRLEEYAKGKRYGVAYLDLLDNKEKELFEEFWKENCQKLIFTLLTGSSHFLDSRLELYLDYFSTWERELIQGAHREIFWGKAYWSLRTIIEKLSPKEALAYLYSLRSYEELTRPLLGQYHSLKKHQGKQVEKHLAAGFYPLYGFGYGRSYAYRQAAPQGSIFKLITAYEALIQKYQKDGQIPNLLQIVDNTHEKGGKIYVGYDIQGKPIPQIYNGGRIPRSHRSGIGTVDLLKAFEVSSNPYFSLLAAECLENPTDLSEAAKKFSYGSRTGIDLPGEIRGNIPNDLSNNRNGLYAMAIGQHSLVVTPLQTAVMLAAIANGGKILKPKIIGLTAGKVREANGQEKKNRVSLTHTHVYREVLMPLEIRGILLEGMRRVADKALWGNLGNLSRQYREYPEAISDLIEMHGELIGKSSTAESRESLDLDLLHGIHLYNHVWFGGIVFESKKEKGKNTFIFNDDFGYPELIVVVYLRYGTWGKDTAPIAAQIAQKWREVKKNSVNRTLLNSNL
jgi:cell division protein FtsI/penicillin-binding protein 2